MGPPKRSEPRPFSAEKTLGVTDSQILSDKTARSLEPPTPPSPVARTQPRRARRLLPLALGGVVVVAAAAAGGWRWHASRTASATKPGAPVSTAPAVPTPAVPTPAPAAPPATVPAVAPPRPPASAVAPTVASPPAAKPASKKRHSTSAKTTKRSHRKTHRSAPPHG